MDIADPVDFPENTKAPGLRALDSALRCPICGELFDGPVTLVCGHCFCSLCIRQTLSQKQACPTCRKPDVNEGHLRVNTSMEEAVSAWKDGRAFVLQMIADREAAATNPPLSKKRKLSEVVESDTLGVAELPTSSSGELQSDGMCACPLCGKSVKMRMINEHIDRQCEDPVEKPIRSSKAQWQDILGPKSQATVRGKGKGKTSRDPDEDEPLPKKSYGVLKDKQIRELLQEYDLPTHGDRNTLINRHTQWVTLFNANLDKSEKFRQSIESLRKDLHQWETQQQKPKLKQEIQDPIEYQRQQRSEFDRLVAAARPKYSTPQDTQEHTQDRGAPPSRESDVIVLDND